MKLLIVVALVGLAAAHSALAAPEKVDCSKVEEVLDDMGTAQGFSALSSKHKLATNMEEMKKRCQEMDDGLKTLRKYNRDCFSSLTQQVFSAMLRGRAQSWENNCGPNNIQEALLAVKCIAEEASEPVKAAENKTQSILEALFEANIADEKERVRRVCCQVEQLKKDFLESTKKCSKHSKVYVDYAESYTSESMTLICMAPEKLDCGKLEPLKVPEVKAKYKFFLNPMIKLVKTMDH